MSKERKFHQLIEKLDREEKDQVWDKIKEQENLRVMEEGETIVVKSPSKKFSWRKIVAVCTTCILVLVGIVGLVRFLPKSATDDDQTANGGTDSASNRYCDSSMYTMTASEMTLKEMAELGDESILYLDWYDGSDAKDYYGTYAYQLNETAEIIGYHEYMMDADTGSKFSLHVILQGYTLEDLQVYKKTNNIEEISGVEIHWASVMGYSYANFEYGAYQYFIIVEYPMAENSVLDIVNELLA